MLRRVAFVVAICLAVLLLAGDRASNRQQDGRGHVAANAAAITHAARLVARANQLRAIMSTPMPPPPLVVVISASFRSPSLRAPSTHPGAVHLRL